MLPSDPIDRPLSVLFLMYAPFAAEVIAHASKLVRFRDLVHVSGLKELRQIATNGRWDLLLSFGTSVVVPRDILGISGLCSINIHAAPPDYPGRDPHHFAAYDSASQYGATLHYMTPEVDQGPIIDVELCAVPAHAVPHEYLALGNAAGMRLAKKLLEEFKRENFPRKEIQYEWTRKARRRSEFVELCRVDANMTSEEFNRRMRAASMPGYNNLWTEVHGRRFQLERFEK